MYKLCVIYSFASDGVFTIIIFKPRNKTIPENASKDNFESEVNSVSQITLKEREKERRKRFLLSQTTASQQLTKVSDGKQ